MDLLDILKNHSLSVTAARVETLSLFVKEQKALSQPQLEKFLGEVFDRTTIYRTLNAFLDAGILHKVPGDEGANKYALHQHSSGCSSHSHHQQEHVHFKCTNCDSTLCIEELPFPNYTAPEGYKFSEINILIQGTCKDCTKIELVEN